MIKRAHINEMAATPTVQEDDVIGLRAAYDQIETHFRALEAMGLGMETYSSIVVPLIMEKFPKDVRTNLIRNNRKKLLEWEMKESRLGDIGESHSLADIADV